MYFLGNEMYKWLTPHHRQAALLLAEIGVRTDSSLGHRPIGANSPEVALNVASGDVGLRFRQLFAAGLKLAVRSPRVCGRICLATLARTGTETHTKWLALASTQTMLQ